jgi:hypothetical protein
MHHFPRFRNKLIVENPRKLIIGRATLEGTPMLPTDRAMLGMTLRYRAAEDAARVLGG